MQQPAGAARGWHNKRTREQRKGRQRNNQLIFRRTTTLIRGVVICHTPTALPGIIVCKATTAIRGIVFGCTAMVTARKRAIVTEMAVTLEEEGDGKGRKRDGNGNKEGNGKQ
jgi:hypothetical protein